MTDQSIPNPSFEELQQLDVATRQMLATFYHQVGVHQGVAIILLANALGELLHVSASSEEMEQSLAAAFKMVRKRAEGQQASVIQ